MDSDLLSQSQFDNNLYPDYDEEDDQPEFENLDDYDDL
jgi:hypothetical protein